MARRRLDSLFKKIPRLIIDSSAQFIVLKLNKTVVMTRRLDSFVNIPRDQLTHRHESETHRGRSRARHTYTHAIFARKTNGFALSGGRPQRSMGTAVFILGYYSGHFTHV